LKKQENSIFCSIKINIRYKDGDIYFIISRGAKNSSKGSKNIDSSARCLPDNKYKGAKKMTVEKLPTE
jgi:hypothetical protein